MLEPSGSFDGHSGTDVDKTFWACLEDFGLLGIPPLPTPPPTLLAHHTKMQFFIFQFKKNRMQTNP